MIRAAASALGVFLAAAVFILALLLASYAGENNRCSRLHPGDYAWSAYGCGQR